MNSGLTALVGDFPTADGDPIRAEEVAPAVPLDGTPFASGRHEISRAKNEKRQFRLAVVRSPRCRSRTTDSGDPCIG